MAERFLAAVGSGDGDVACSLLAADTRKALEDEEQKPCGEAIGAVRIDAGSPIAVELYLTERRGGSRQRRARIPVATRRTGGGSRPPAASDGDGPPEDVPMDCELEA